MTISIFTSQYLKSFLWYTDTKLPEEEQSQLVEMLTEYLSPQDKDNIMRTVAEKYIDEGMEKGIAIGEARGEAKGEHNKAVIIAKEMFTRGFKIPVIAKITGLQETFVRSIVQK